MIKKKGPSSRLSNITSFILVFLLAYFGFLAYFKVFNEKRVLKQMVERLSAESRIAEVLVADVEYNPVARKNLTTIKFLEYDSTSKPLPSRYFTFSGNVIQFQSLVARFDDIHVKNADALRGKSAFLFWKVFVLDGKNTQEYTITEARTVPRGYEVDKVHSRLEREIWAEFWDYALDPQKAGKKGIKNVQIEAPGTKFVPGMLYTIRIEHDGGMRIDAQKIPEILKGEKVLK